MKKYMKQVNLRIDDGFEISSEAESFRDFAATNTIKVSADFNWSREEANERSMKCLAINPFK